MKRRDFVKQTSLASGLLMVPSFIKAFDESLLFNSGFKRLVVIQLSGGNDGLNTIIPYRNDIYYRSRPALNIRKNDVVDINGEVGFHSSLQPLKALYDEGYLTILNNVGYPNPVRSHFRSLDIWQTASHSHQYLQSGWLGRYLDQNSTHPHDAIEVGETLSLALKGENVNAIATTDATRLSRLIGHPYFKKLITNSKEQHLSEHNLGYLYKTMIDAKSSADYIFEKSKTFKSSKTYPKHGFGKQLKTTAEFINSGLSTRVYYTALGGFDTHANQTNPHKRLLNIYAESVKAFVEDLKSNNTFKDTLILTFSEFGRRVKQNAANGTDHGAANNVFLIGENLKTKGFYNAVDDLRDLDQNGDIKYEIDFRRIYATILNNWMQVDSTKVLSHNFAALDFI